MDPESKKLLEKTLALAEENNKLLVKVRGAQKRLMFWRIAKYVLIIGFTLGAFYFLEPYIDSTKNFYQSVFGVTESVQNLSDSSSIQDLLEKL